MQKIFGEPGGRFRLIACGSDGRPNEGIEGTSQELEAACLQSARLYERIGYQPPWVSYLATWMAVGSAAAPS